MNCKPMGVGGRVWVMMLSTSFFCASIWVFFFF